MYTNLHNFRNNCFIEVILQSWFSEVSRVNVVFLALFEQNRKTHVKVDRLKF